MSTLDDYRNNSGEFAEESAEVQDAVVPEEEVNQEVDEDVELDEAEDQEEVEEDEEFEDTDELTDDADSGEEQLTPKEKTAFEKRLERERRKLEEQVKKQLEAEYEPHKKIIERLGGDPQKIEQAIQENQLVSQANQLADQYGWTEDQVQHYIQGEQAKLQQQQLQNELQELRIANQINELRDKPEFAGINDLKQEIVSLVSKTGGALDVSQAYWALGGSQRAQQMAREAEQRQAFKRRTGRVVSKDGSAAASTEKVIPPNVLQEAKRMGMTEEDVRELMEFEATDIEQYRKSKAK